MDVCYESALFSEVFFFQPAFSVALKASGAHVCKFSALNHVTPLTALPHAALSTRALHRSEGKWQTTLCWLESSGEMKWPRRICGFVVPEMTEKRTTTFKPYCEMYDWWFTFWFVWIHVKMDHYGRRTYRPISPCSQCKAKIIRRTDWNGVMQDLFGIGEWEVLILNYPSLPWAGI